MSTRLLRSLCALLFTCSTTAAALPLPGDAQLTAEQVIADINLAEEAYRRVHPGYTRYATETELATAWEQLRGSAREENGLTSAELYLAVSRTLPLIRCDHTKAELPAKLRAGRKEAPLYLPLRWEWIDGRALVQHAAPASPVYAGDELLAVDGVAIATLVAEVAPYVPVDGYTDFARAGQMGASLEFMGGAVDHFGALLHSPPAQAQLTVAGAEGTTRTVEVKRIDHAAWTALGEQAGLARNFKDAVSFERLGDDVGYLRVDTFVNYRQPVDPHDLYGPVFEAMAQEERGTLILDLRRNGGGSNDAAHALLSYLIDSPLRMHTDKRVATLDLDGIREHMSTWDKRALRPNRLGFRKRDDGTWSLRAFVDDDLRSIKPKRPYFGGELLLLIGADNSSGSTNLAAMLEQQERTTLIGAATGGSAEGPTAGLLFTLTLPNSGVRMRLPFFRYRNNVSSFERGMGLAPDVEVRRTFDSERKGRDPALEAALALIAARR